MPHKKINIGLKNITSNSLKFNLISYFFNASKGNLQKNVIITSKTASLKTVTGPAPAVKEHNKNPLNPK